jgi:hypothetical protein
LTGKKLDPILVDLYALDTTDLQWLFREIESVVEAAP